MDLFVESAPARASLSSISGQVISFPEGLIGCENWCRFMVEADVSDDAVLLLRCLDQPGIQLWVTDPFEILSDYEISIGDDEARRIGLEDLSDAVVLCILTVRPPPIGVTANLVGPLVINVRKRLGLQLILADSSYSVRHPVHPLAARVR